MIAPSTPPLCYIAKKFFKKPAFRNLLVIALDEILAKIESANAIIPMYSDILSR